MRTCSTTAIWFAALCFCAAGQTPPPKSAPATPETPASKEVQANEYKGVPPRAAPTDYQGRAKAGAITIAADFQVHAVPTPEATFSTEDYVTVEVAFFGPADKRLKI